MLEIDPAALAARIAEHRAAATRLLSEANWHDGAATALQALLPAPAPPPAADPDPPAVGPPPVVEERSP